jgi:PqqD family protein of HPr-rel-A system
MKNFPKWRTPPHSRLHWQSWEDESVVYNSRSGSTHLLDLVAAETLKILEKQSATLPELVDIVASLFKIEPNAELSRHLEKLVLELEKLELLEMVQK